MGFFRFIFSKSFLVNLVLVGVVAIAAVVGLYFWLNFYTQHDVTVEVPNLSGVPIDRIAIYSDSTNVNFVIIDSLYSDLFPRGTVVGQEPTAGYKVKCGRKIYLTVNALLPKQVMLPDVRNLSLRQATTVLETVGLKLGILQYVPDIAENAVLDQKINGVSAAKGETVFHGSSVDLVLGAGLGNTKVAIPYLIYSPLNRAIEKIRSASLKLAVFKLDSTATDTSFMRVYKQVPAFSKNGQLSSGSSMILYLTADTLSIAYDTLLFAAPAINTDSIVVEADIYGDFEKNEPN